MRSKGINFESIRSKVPHLLLMIPLLLLLIVASQPMLASPLPQAAEAVGLLTRPNHHLQQQLQQQQQQVEHVEQMQEQQQQQQQQVEHAEQMQQQQLQEQQQQQVEQQQVDQLHMEQQQQEKKREVASFPRTFRIPTFEDQKPTPGGPTNLLQMFQGHITRSLAKLGPSATLFRPMIVLTGED
jgi:TolA-binding protein